MRTCCLCHKKVKFFIIPKNEREMRKWSHICRIQLSIGDIVCEDHLAPSDIIEEPRKVLLAPNAMSCLLPVKNEEKCSTTNQQHHITENNDFNNYFLEYVHDNSKYKCRCCTSPSSSNFTQLDSYIKLNEGTEKTYKDLLYEITNLSISVHHENILPQHICEKCETPLKNSYNFIQQVCRVSQEHLGSINQLDNQEVIINIENLQEPLLKISEASISEQANAEELIGEPLYAEFNMEIKEQVEIEAFMPIILNNNESQEKKDFSQNSNSHNYSKNEADIGEPESIKSVDMDLSNESIARCDICHKVYRNEKCLNIHKRTHLPEENKIPCSLCNYKASDLKVHMGLVHGHDKVNEYFKTALNSNKTYSCNLCPRSYGIKDSLRKHIRRKHLSKSSKDDTLKKSKTIKPKEKRFLCTYCGQSYNSQNCLQIHALTHKRERQFSCDICNKTFKCLKYLKLHQIVHSEEKPYECLECGKTFKRVQRLKIHMRVHTDLRPYKCNECGKTFKYPAVLQDHMRIHTGQTPFHCETCGEAFSFRTSLNNHRLKHGHVK